MTPQHVTIYAKRGHATKHKGIMQVKKNVQPHNKKMLATFLQ